MLARAGLSVLAFLDPAPLPLSDYVSTLQVVEGRRGYTTVLWSSSFRNNSDGKMKDEEVIGFISHGCDRS